MKNGSVCAGIVLYHPDEERLAQNIAAIQGQVERIILIDNGTSVREKLGQAYADTQSFVWIENSENLGIAKALNQIVAQAKTLGFDWVLTLDQDSVVCADMVVIQAEILENNPNAAIIVPSIVDRNLMTLEEYQKQELPDCESINICITSGALTNVQSVEDVGGFCEKLFIDFVDIELCLRLRKKGYDIVQANKTYLLHEVGRMQKVYVFPRFGELTGIEWFKRPKTVSNHSPMRVYYQSRNLIYMLRKYGTFFVPHPFRYWISFCRGIALRLLVEKEKVRKLLAFWKGVFAGIFMDIRGI